MTEVDDMRTFPIQGGWGGDPARRLLVTRIPWWLAEAAYGEYVRRYGNGQSLERLAERGGFGRGELLELLRQSK